MPSHVTNVYNDIDDGMLLLSLSLNERSNDRRGLEIEEVYDSSFDDPMDIDDTGELSNHMDIDDTTFEIDHVASDNYANKREDDNGTNNEEERREDGLFSLLSPTLMGAKLAIKKPLLLMPPPTVLEQSDSKTESASSVDYEYDTSSFKPMKSNGLITRKTNSSTFQPSNIDSFLFHSDGISLGQLLGGYQDLHSNYQQPVTIHNHHHHYYYYNKDESVPSPPSNNNLQSLEHEQRNLQMQQYKQQLEEHQLYLQEYKRNNQILLPSPWQHNISPIERVPYLLMSYLQMLINFIASLYGVYLVYCLFRTINTDIKTKIEEQQTNLIISIESCRRSYYQNGCDDKDNLVPLLVSKCQKFEKCMKQDPYKLSNVSIMSAEIIGMIINSLIEPLSLKFYLFMLAFILIIFACNFTFGYIRAKAYYGGSMKYSLDKLD